MFLTRRAEADFADSKYHNWTEQAMRDNEFQAEI
jgi:hypothetical protein